MRVAIIGATGFIGGHLCDACVRRGDDVVVMARSPEAVAHFARRGASAYQGDLENEEAIARTCRDADVVFNAAGALGKWQTPREELERVNTHAAGTVIRCAADAGARKVVHASTAGVSGPLPNGVVADEEYPCKPATDYQRTKFLGEHAALGAHRDTGIPLTVVRPTFVYGPGDRHKLSMFRAVASGKVVLINDGASLLHPVYVDDLVEGMLLAAERAPGAGEVYILAGDCPVSTRSLLGTIADDLKAPAPTVSLPARPTMLLASVAEAVGRAVGKEPPLTRSKVRLFSENYAYSIDKARRQLGYAPSVHLPEGIRRTVDWYARNYLLSATQVGVHARDRQ